MIPIELTTEQAFALQRMRLELNTSGFPDEAQNMILELVRQNMIKDGLIRHLISKGMAEVACD